MIDTSSQPLSAPRLLLLFTALLICAVSQWFIFHQTEWFYSSWGLGLGALVAAWALGSPRPLAVVGRGPSPAPVQVRGGVFLATLGLAAAIAGMLLLSFAWLKAFGLGWGLVVGGLALWSYGLSRLDAPLRKPVAGVPWVSWELIALGLVIGVGLFLRFYRYDYFPPPDGVCAVEEPQSGQGADMILRGARPWEFMLDRWLPVFGFLTIGHSLAAIRVPFTIVSWLTIPPLYLLMRELMSRPAALFATLLFAFCRWHLIYARHAHAVFGPTLPLILLVLWLCVRVYKYGGLAAYPWIGAISAYTLYTYAGYRATIVFVALMLGLSFLHHLWVMRTGATAEIRGAAQRSLKVQLFGAVFALGGFALLVVPLISQLSWNPWYFFEAAERATGDTGYYTSDTTLYWQRRIERIRIATMMFSHFGDGSPTFNMPGAPQLDPVSGTLFVIGLAYCAIWAWYRFQGFFAFYFLFLFLVGTVYVHNYDVRRLQGIIPLIFILIGYAADRFGQVVLVHFGKIARGGLAVLALLISVVALWDNYRVYFREMMHYPPVRSSFHNTYTVAISYLHQLPDNAYLLLISDMSNFFTPSDFEWLRGDRVPGRTSVDLLPLFRGDNAPWNGRELHLLIQEPFYESAELAELLEERFPETQCSRYEHRDQPAFADFLACQVPSRADGRGFSGGIKAQYFRGAAAEPFLERVDPVISFAFTPHSCRLPGADGKPPCRVVWEGEFEILEAGDYVLSADVRHGLIDARIDDQTLRVPSLEPPDSDKTAQSRLTLAAGMHRVRIESSYAGLEGVGTRLRIQRYPDGPWQLVRFARFDQARRALGSAVSSFINRSSS
ncbi:MAG TPA: glycosyltransferase family 39 protein [Terriglobales bacterium]|nr:glycosyltransferase family 39 protein [Terriglobales bacterium]